MTKLDHEGRKLLLHAMLDGELDAAGAVEMEQMLAADPELAAEQARLMALRRAIRTHARRDEAPASLHARVVAAIEGPQTRPHRSATDFLRTPPTWRSFATAIAATVVLTIGLQHLIVNVGTPNATLQAIVSAQMRSQISGQPVDVVSSDQHTVKPWLASKLPVAATVVDLTGEGFPLLGGRIDIIAGAAAPTLVYKRRGHLISVTELRADAANYPATPSRRTLDGYPVIVWSEGERAYAAISDISPTELDAFVAAFRLAVTKERGSTGAPNRDTNE